MNFVPGEDYFVAKPSVMLRAEPDGRADSLNQLIFGDWTRCRAPETDGWVKIFSRRNTGFVRSDELTSERALEVNFLDIGQGDSAHVVTPRDEVFLIDGGQTDNLYRFIAWRYNLRDRRVPGVDGVTADDPGVRDPFAIDYVVISHPDKDHYYGLRHVFGERKLAVRRVLHNGIFERKEGLETDRDEASGFKWFHDLGRSFRAGRSYLLDLVRTSEDMDAVLDRQAELSSGKQYYSTLKKLRENPSSADCSYQMVEKQQGHLEGFEADKILAIEILGPVTETIEVEGESLNVLRTLGSEGKTKNGHSVVFRFSIGHLRVLLGGDLNTEAEDYLLRYYTGVDADASDLEKDIYELEAKGDTLTHDERQILHDARAVQQQIVEQAKKSLEVDVAKACHHGSHHFSETFLQALNSIAVVISSGDEEKYGHPRPDALGAFGKHGRGHRPLIFSTEIARSTREFTPLMKYFEKLQEFQRDIEEAATEEEADAIRKQMEEAKDSNVALYGMVTLRSDGATTIIATKLEVPNGDIKWDIHQLVHNDKTGQMEYKDRTKEH